MLSNGFIDIPLSYYTALEDDTPPSIYIFSRALWTYLKFPSHTIGGKPQDILEMIRDWYFRAKWYEIYDFVEFLVGWEPKLQIYFNQILEEENSGYRVINNEVVPITSAEEVKSIEDALGNNARNPIGDHINQAISLLSDRRKPDYRNSIKESISAVEALCQQVTGNPRATLGDALSTISKHGDNPLHGALIEGFKKLYGYTSDADGIRHSLMKESNLQKSDAIYFLVSCSAFINYLNSKKA